MINKYLLLRLEHQKERNPLWPLVGDHGSYCPRGGKNFQNMNAIRGRKSKGGKEFVVKIFVGVEYECPRGHRFMASAPDKVLKATGNGIVKDSGNKVTSSTADMPLYFPCPCRSVKAYAIIFLDKSQNPFSEQIHFFFICLLDKLNR